MKFMKPLKAMHSVLHLKLEEFTEFPNNYFYWGKIRNKLLGNETNLVEEYNIFKVEISAWKYFEAIIISAALIQCFNHTLANECVCSTTLTA